jgi:hypothetical protein
MILSTQPHNFFLIKTCLPSFLPEQPFYLYHPGLIIERITNDPTAWSARVDKKYRISFEPMAFLASGAPY